MEIRKVQITGGSSYIISLPKAWVIASNIKKNEPLGLITRPDGTLLIMKKIAEEQEQKTKEFNVDNITDHTYLFRCLIGAYIDGYTIIKIKSSKKMPPFVRTSVREFTHMTIGQEVMEETHASIVIRDLLKPVEMPFNTIIHRMYVIVKSMHEDAISALKNRDKILAEDVISRDNDVDRLNWLIARQCNMLSGNINLAEKMGFTIGMVVNYFQISRIIERIGDHAVRIAKNIPPFVDKKVDKKFIDNIVSASKLALETFNKSIESFNKRDIIASNDNIETVTRIVSLCEKINTLALHQKDIIPISAGYIVESIKRTGEYAGDLSEVVINYLIGKEK